MSFWFSLMAAAAIWWHPGITAFRQILQTDFPATLLVLLALAIAIGALERADEGDGDDCTALAMAVAAAATIKLSAAPVALLGLALWPVARRLSRRELIGLAVSATLLPTAWVVQNIALSGCLAYPVTASCTSLPWALPIEEIKSEAASISVWAKVPRHKPSDPIFSDLTWTVEWFARHKSLIVTWGMSLLAAAAIAVLGLLTGRQSSSLRPLVIPAAATACGLAFWFFAAPDPRFGAGFIVGTIALAFAAALSTVSSSIRTTLTIALVVLLVSRVSWEFGRMLIRLPKAEAQWRIPPKEFGTKTTTHGYTLAVTKTDDQCWIEEPPCTPYFDPNLAMERLGPFKLLIRKITPAN
jgi:hypothetical protein